MNKYKLCILEALTQKKLTQKGLQSLVGKLSFAAAVVPARPFLRRLIDMIYTVKKPFYFIKITAEMRKDLTTWLHFLSNYNGITYFRMLKILPNDHVNMCSDASILGMGATFKNNWIQDRYPASWKQLHASNIIGSTFLEFYPIYVLIAMFGNQLANQSVLYKSDNQGVVDIINKQTSTSKLTMKLVRRLVLLLISHNIFLHSEHIPGLKNVLCDRISRFQVTK